MAWARRMAAIVVWGLLACDHLPAVAAGQPNILLVLADDQRWDTIRALGNEEIRTPHLDRLVENGFHFTSAYCMGSMIPAVCLPSRTMLLTGRSLWRIPSLPFPKTAPAGIRVLPEVLRRAGYITLHCGKKGNSCPFAHTAFDINIESTERTAESAARHADSVIDFLSRHDGTRPFFIYLAPPVPHDPRLAPDDFTRLYAADKLSLSKSFMPRHPFDNGELAVRDELLAPHPRTPEVMKEHLAAYYATISHLDHELGRILAAIEGRGWKDETIVIYSSDQGLAVGGRHGLMGKQNLYEHFKSPLVISGPGIERSRSDALVYLHDLYPTICEMSGAMVPEGIDGKSLVPIMGGKVASVRDELFCAYRDCQRMIRDRRWKLITYDTGKERHVQLFDLSNDPDELKNLADDPAFASERQRLEALLLKARRANGDPVVAVSE